MSANFFLPLAAAAGEVWLRVEETGGLASGTAAAKHRDKLDESRFQFTQLIIITIILL